jgi:DNA polymerase (family 10)
MTVCPPTEFGIHLVFATGSNSHIDGLRSIAQERGVELDNGAAIASELEVYEALGLPLIPPELRERGDEIGAAQNGSLPELLAAKDLGGDLHCHTRWSDGANSIEEMASAARELGRKYLAISDHSVSLAVAHGLDEARVAEQSEAVKEANRAVDGIEILHGTEVDILADGRLDYPDELLGGLDWVSAAVHSGFRQSSEDMTKRIVAAIQNPHVDAVAHPTGRLLNSRDGYDLNMDAVLEAAAETGTALEIDAMPDRLDLPEEHARKAGSMGVSIVINSDSHSTEHLDYLKYGVTAARRAWLEAVNILNSRGLDGLRDWREDRRGNSA